jgi:hypothetical protein
MGTVLTERRDQAVNPSGSSTEVGFAQKQFARMTLCPPIRARSRPRQDLTGSARAIRRARSSHRPRRSSPATRRRAAPAVPQPARCLRQTARDPDRLAADAVHEGAPAGEVVPSARDVRTAAGSSRSGSICCPDPTSSGRRSAPARLGGGLPHTPLRLASAPGASPLDHHLAIERAVAEQYRTRPSAPTSCPGR